MAQPCTHCGLPVWDKATDNQELFCCIGCEMLHDLDVESGTFLVPPDLLIRWIIAFVGAMLLLFLSITAHIEEELPVALHYFSAFIATGIVGLLGREVCTALRHEWKKRRVSLATLIFLGALSSYVISLYHLFYYGRHTFFETSAMILCFYVGSLLIDLYLKNRIKQETRNWNPSVPDVLAVNGNGGNQPIRKPADEIKPGETILTETGAEIPLDGMLESSRGFVNESYLTGEETPVLKQHGDKIQAGSIAYDEGLRIKPLTDYAHSSLQEYEKRYHAAAAQSTRYEKLARKAARWLVLIMIPVSVAVFFWYVWNGPVDAALSNSLSVLLIACPCAFAIAIPAALWITHTELHRNGLMVAGDSNKLEELARVNHIIFDKTGTLTGKPEVYHFEITNGKYAEIHIKQLMLSLEATQQHPLAEAIRSFTGTGDKEEIQVSEIRQIPGMGVEGVWLTGVQQKRVQILNHTHPKVQNDLEKGQFGLFVDQCLTARWTIYYPLKPGAKKVLTNLSTKYELSILSGDPVPKKALESAYWNYMGNLSPGEKSAYIEEQKTDGQRLLFVGDGLNDLPAMAGADVTLVMYNGATQTKRSADFVLYNPEFKMIPEFLKMARSARRTFIQNIFWALIYNIFGLGFAIAGFLTPVISIAAMILSSIFVTANSLRLGRIP